jgi:shikimate kinase/3-dehydroquinate synthase
MIFLTGFMGSGKTTVGKDLSHLLSMPFVDLDERISNTCGTTIPEIFRCAGQKAFRSLESDALWELTGQLEQSVVATGGGLPVDPDNRTVMKSCGLMVYLRTSFAALKQRIPEDPNRPLWNEDASDLFDERREAYEAADIIIDTDDKKPCEIAREICSAIKGHLNPVPVLLPGRSYPVYIGEGIFEGFNSLLRRHFNPEGIFILVDENVFALHKDIIHEALAGNTCHIMEVPIGEESKSYGFLSKILDEMFSHQVNRSWICLGIGGGVTGDIAGFAASIFMRGIPAVHVPTTLLSQVDSSIGGKTGINTAFGKNLLGTFHQPIFVLSDAGFLNTLDDVQIKNAMAEVIKYGIIMDRDLFEYIESSSTYDYKKIVTMCSRDKAHVVSNDEREGGLRRILNFGHTLGHALEQLSNYNLYHGQAVAVGMLFSAWLSTKLGLLDQGDLKRIRSVIKKDSIIPEGIKLPGPEALKNTIIMDKKASKEGIHFVLTPSIGDVTVKKLTDSEVLDAYKEFLDGF